MENKSFSTKAIVAAAHLPTVFTVTGFAVYWLELYFIKLGRGRASFLATLLFAAYALFLFTAKRGELFRAFQDTKQGFFTLGLSEKIFLIGSVLLMAAIFLCAFSALLLPPHLIQESDSLNYHLTIPRQHLILESFKHLSWSAADLRVLPLEFSLAPYIFATPLPNKLPQLIFILGLASVAVALTRKLGGKTTASTLLILTALFGSHAFGIQMATIMFDIAGCYFFIAAIDSLLSKRLLLAAIEFSFFLWAKPFYAAYAFLAICIILITRIIAKRLRIEKIDWGFNDTESALPLSPEDIKKFTIYSAAAALAIAGPFLIKSLYCAGTPLFPFMPGMLDLSHIDKNSAWWQSVISTSKLTLSMQNAYGGRGLGEFITHFWILAVPEKEVMNRFDYPLGLPYLLFLGPFVYFSIRAVLNKRLPVLPLFAIAYWGIWWMGSHQSRFLFIALALIFITVSAKINRFRPALATAMIIALCLNFISLFRAHYQEFRMAPADVLREKDRRLLKAGKDYYGSGIKGAVTLEEFDAAYAEFPVKVVPSKNVPESEFWVLEGKKDENR